MIISTNEIIGPDLAAYYLSLNHPNNRKLKTETVNEYSRDMLFGNWEDDGTPIQFDTNGCLINGQHRLSAVVKSKKEIAFTVQRNVPAGSIKTIDCGVPRTLIDRFKIYGEQDPVYRDKASHALARIIAVDILGFDNKVKLSLEEYKAILHQYYNCARFVIAFKGKAGIANTAMLYSILRGLSYDVSETVTRAFIAAISRGEINTDVTGVNWKAANDLRAEYLSRMRYGGGGSPTVVMKNSDFATRQFFMFAQNVKRARDDVWPARRELFDRLENKFVCDSFKEKWFKEN